MTTTPQVSTTQVDRGADRDDRSSVPPLSGPGISVQTGLLMLLALVLFGWWWFDLRHARDANIDPLPAIETTAAPTSDNPAGARGDTASRSRQTAAVQPPRTISRPLAPTAARPLPGRTPAPEYPAVALRRGEGGTVVLRVAVGADGRPGDIEVSRHGGSRELDRAAVEAVRQWRFAPATERGQAVASVVEVPVDFKLPQ